MKRRRNSKKTTDKTLIFEKGNIPSDLSLKIDVPIVLRGFGEEMLYFKKFATDDFLKSLKESDQHELHVRVSNTMIEECSFNDFENPRIQLTSLLKFLNSYSKDTTSSSLNSPVHYLSSYGDDYNVDDMNEINHENRKHDAFSCFPELKKVIPKVMINNDDETHTTQRVKTLNKEEKQEVDPGYKFHDICKTLQNRQYVCRNLALWISAKNVSTPLHYDGYLTCSLIAGSGKKIWYLAPPDATASLKSCLIYNEGQKDHTSKFKPWYFDQEFGNTMNNEAGGGGLLSQPSVHVADVDLNQQFKTAKNFEQNNKKVLKMQLDTCHMTSSTNTKKPKQKISRRGGCEIIKSEADDELLKWFHRIEVGPGDLLIVPSGWWHAVTTTGRCVALNWWWIANKRNHDEMMLLQKESVEEGDVWTCSECSMENVLAEHEKKNTDRPHCTNCCHIKGVSGEWRCLWCATINKTKKDHHFMKCKICHLRRGEKEHQLSQMSSTKLEEDPITQVKGNEEEDKHRVNEAELEVNDVCEQGGVEDSLAGNGGKNGSPCQQNLTSSSKYEGNANSASSNMSSSNNSVLKEKLVIEHEIRGGRGGDDVHNKWLCRKCRHENELDFSCDGVEEDYLPHCDKCCFLQGKLSFWRCKRCTTVIHNKNGRKCHTCHWVKGDNQSILLTEDQFRGSDQEEEDEKTSILANDTETNKISNDKMSINQEPTSYIKSKKTDKNRGDAVITRSKKSMSLASDVLPLSSPSSWRCITCTFRNQGLSDVCEMCETQKSNEHVVID